MIVIAHGFNRHPIPFVYLFPATDCLNCFNYKHDLLQIVFFSVHCYNVFIQFGIALMRETKVSSMFANVNWLLNTIVFKAWPLHCIMKIIKKNAIE